MFLCDFFNFLLLIFGFSAFGVSYISRKIFLQDCYLCPCLILLLINYDNNNLTESAIRDLLDEIIFLQYISQYCNLCFVFISDSTRRRWSNGLFARKSSSHAFPVDVAIAVCSYSYRQSPFSSKIYSGKINFSILLGIWCTPLDVLHFTERDRDVGNNLICI